MGVTMCAKRFRSLTLSSLLFILLNTFVQGKYEKALKSNVAKGMAHRWIVQRCMDQEPLFVERHPITLKHVGNDKAYKVSDFGVTNVGRHHRRHLLVKTITAAELQKNMEDRFRNKVEYAKQVQANYTAAKEWAEKHQMQEYYEAVKLTEDTCFNSTFDRGPMMLGNEMPREMFDFMMLYHKEKGGCMFGVKGGCSTVLSPPPPSPPPSPPNPPHVYTAPPIPPPSPPAPCPTYQEKDCSMDLVVVMLSVMVGIGIGAIGTIYVVK